MATRKRDTAHLMFLVASRDLPKSVDLKEHSIEFAGRKDFPPKLISGVYGPQSKQTALVVSANWSRDHAQSSGRNMMLQLDVSYHIENLVETRAIPTREVVEETGWLHLERVTAAYRNEVREGWIEWVLENYKGRTLADELEAKSLVEIALEYPEYVGKLFARRSPKLLGVVHPIRPTLDPSLILWVATVRYEPDRFVAPVVRFLPDIPVIL